MRLVADVQVSGVVSHTVFGISLKLAALSVSLLKQVRISQPTMRFLLMARLLATELADGTYSIVALKLPTTSNASHDDD